MTVPARLLAAGALGTALLAPLSAGAAPVSPGCDGQRATIVGTRGDDHLVGTSGPDVIVGLGGDDRIEAGAGRDVVCGLAGADVIDGGPGNDRIFGGIDSWWFDRGGPNRVGDRVLPGPGKDYVDLGADRRPGDETLERDTLVYRDLDHGIVAHFWPHEGSVEADGTDTVRVHGQMGVVGTRFDDTLIGSPRADTLRGLGGQDYLYGYGGDDLLLPGGGVDEVYGDSGNDDIGSSGGADALRGGPGDDFVDTQGNPDVAIVTLGAGADQLNTTVRPRGGFDADAGTGHDTIVLGYARHDDLPPADLDLGSGVVTLGTSATGRLASFEWWVMLDDQPLTIHGTDKAERIEAGGQGPVRAWMAGGDDAVYASGSDDFIDSGPGDDLVWAYQGTDTCLETEHARGCEVRQLPGRVRAREPAVMCHGRPSTIVGTPHRDLLVGTDGPDVIVGLGGDDRIEGGAGDDVICAGLDGMKPRTSNGGWVYYLAVGDTVLGGAGDDLIDLGYDERQVTNNGFAPDVLVLGGAHGATLRLAEAGGWSVADGAGHDRIVGQPRLDVRGSQGPDRIWGTSYDDHIDGRGGDDVVRGLGGEDVLLDSGAGDDRDRLLGGRSRDTLNAASGPDVLEGGPGNDDLIASDDAVSLDGGVGDDQLVYGGAGVGCADLTGGQGSDFLSLIPSAGNIRGRIEVDLDGGAVGPCGAVTGVEILSLTDQTSEPERGPHWVVRGTPRADQVTLFEGSRLTAHLRGGDDTLVGGQGDDVLDGGPGDDTADGGSGEDRCPRVEHRTSC
ncbi:hypothetical protein ISU07_14500 [Nocardioides islandensis]|uniref:Calcium-binding protein n=1 Tax=Nocardioides islandensis TaxID=433663 RepID=A0A930VEV2_9ACTN|nr:hypothetical protein [Nocardioides islandensis]MBF4764341.1 hypothetical protein [Nocardioides islandensis]